MTDNSAAQAKLQAMIGRLSTLPTELVRQSAPEIGKRGEAIMRTNIAAQRDPEGLPWPISEDGRLVLLNAGKALSSSVHGTVVLWQLHGVEALHNNGRVKGGKRRQILPTRRIPNTVNAAIQFVLAKNFQELAAP